jgi:hypothetical protein
MEETRDVYKILARKPLEKHPFGKQEIFGG